MAFNKNLMGLGVKLERWEEYIRLKNWERVNF